MRSLFPRTRICAAVLVLAALLAPAAEAQAPHAQSVPFPASDATDWRALLETPSGGGTPDTTDWRAYFPLEVGNAWQYLVTDDLGSGYYGYEVHHDTLIEGRRYYAVRTCYDREPVLCSDVSEINPFDELRYDTTQALVVEWLSPKGFPPYDGWWEPVPCALDAPFDSIVECADGSESYFIRGGLGYDLVLPPDTVRGVTYKEFDAIPVVTGAVSGIGVVSRWFTKIGPRYEALVYARVGGVEYGTPFFVFPTAAEPPPDPGGGLVLGVSPNPSAGAARVSLVLPEAGEAAVWSLSEVEVSVYDMLGRRVAVLHDGRLGAGEHALAFDASRLPPGVYVVRAEVGEMRAARTVTVLR